MNCCGLLLQEAELGAEIDALPASMQESNPMGLRQRNIVVGERMHDKIVRLFN